MKKRGSVKQRNLFLIIGGVIISLIGLQLYWMITGIRLQQLAAERSLKNDLNNVIKEVEESAYCFFYYSKAFIKKDEGIYIIKQRYKDKKFVAPPAGYIDTLSLYNTFYFKKDTFFDKNSYLDFQTPTTVDISLKFKFAVPSQHVKKIDTNSYQLPNINMANFREALNNSRPAVNMGSRLPGAMRSTWTPCPARHPPASRYRQRYRCLRARSAA